MADISGLLQAEDMQSGYDGKIYATILGRRFLIAYAISIRTSAKKTKTKCAVLGRRAKVNKSGPLEYSGKMKLHYVQDDFRELMDLYKQGYDTYFELQVINEGTGTKAGKRDVIYYGVNIDDLDLSILDAETEELTEEVNFTFEDYEVAKKFNRMTD